MKKILTKEDVADAMARLASQGKKPTLTALHAALEHRGSMSTLVRLKAEIDGEGQAAKESSEAFQAFKQIWALARNEGRTEQSLNLAEQQSNFEVLAVENERLEGQVAAAIQQAEHLNESRASAEAECRRIEQEMYQMATALKDAGLKLASVSQDLADTRASHAKETAALREELGAVRSDAHEMELQLVRIRALQESKSTAGSES